MIYAVFPDNVKEITVYGLTQWDKGRKLQITLPSLPASFEVHFANKRAELAYPVKGTSSSGVATVSIPNIVLMNSADVVAWVYDSTSDDVGETIATIHLPLERRTKPADYYYTEDALEVIDYSALKEQVDRLSGHIDALGGGTGLNSTAKNLLITILRNGIYSADQSANITALETALSSGADVPVEPEQPEVGIVQTGSILAITSGVTATQTGTVLAIA